MNTNADPPSWVLQTVDPGVDKPNSSDTSLAYDPVTGEATIAYQRGDDTLKFFRRDFLSKSWNDGELVAVGLFRGVSLAYDGGGNPSISFHEFFPFNIGDDILKFARWDGSFWVIETVDTSPFSVRGNSLAYDADGTAYISYTAMNDVGVMEVKLAQRIGTNAWEIETVTSCVQARSTSLKFDSLWNPSVAYSDILFYRREFNNQRPLQQIRACTDFFNGS